MILLFETLADEQFKTTDIYILNEDNQYHNQFEYYHFLQRHYNSTVMFYMLEI